MAQRSLNKVQLIGNLTRDPELRYTPQGTAVCTFGLATNRTWATEGGEKKEETEFHRIVAWNKLAELCSQLLFKGRKVYVEGRLQTRRWTAQDGTQRQTTEIVINDMMILDSKRAPEEVSEAVPEEPEAKEEVPVEETAVGGESDAEKAASVEKEKKKTEDQQEEEKVKAGDIPF
jgi:single-strand DNA-binding protein